MYSRTVSQALMNKGKVVKARAKGDLNWNLD